MSISEPENSKTGGCQDGCERACGCESQKCETQQSSSPERREEPTEGQGPSRRQTVMDRRAGLDRRQMSREESGYTGPDRRADDRRTGLERRRGPGRRRSDDRKSAEEGEMNAEQFEFIMAIETYKKVNKKIYPTWTEVLEVIRQLGYRKVKAREVDLEAPEAPIQDAA